MVTISKSICILLFSMAPAYAGGHGGHNTTFDPNSYGGGWTTITCNGSGADDTAWAAWKTASVAANPALAKLHVIGNCAIGSASNLTQGIKNALIWGYGASVSVGVSNSIGLGNGNPGFSVDNLHSARINSASINDTTVTVNDGHVGFFSVGNWICVTGLGIEGQPFEGFPPNHQFLEYKSITNIAGNVITLSSPLKNAYKSTWPPLSAGDATHPDQGGPATIYVMTAGWDTNAQVMGLHFMNGQVGNFSVVGRNVIVQDVYFNREVALGPTNAQTIWFIGTELGGVEVDKEIESINFVNCTGTLISVQSASVNNMLIQSCIFNANSTLLGMPQNTIINNTMFLGDPQVRPGPQLYGHGVTIAVDGTHFTTVQQSVVQVTVSDMTFTTGTFSIARAAPNWYKAIAWGVPGQKYYFGDNSGNAASNPFTITDVTDNGTTTSFVTNLGALPGICPGAACVLLVAYPAATITQKFSGPADLTQFAAP